jgi:hypothetical protein
MSSRGYSTDGFAFPSADYYCIIKQRKLLEHQIKIELILKDVLSKLKRIIRKILGA